MTLAKAVAAFIAAPWAERTKMNVPAWATTYRCGVEDVRAEYERQMTVKSQQQNNNYEEMDK